MFFLPAGFDILFKFTIDLTGSFWRADMLFYCISGCFWLLYIILTKLLNKFNNN